MKKIIVYFKGAAEMVVSDYEYEQLTGGNTSARCRESKDSIALRISAGAVDHMNITPTEFNAQHDGLGRRALCV